MSKFRLFCIALLLLTASRALSQDIQFDFDDKADFSKFRTYKWITMKSVAPIDELTDEQIKAAVDSALVRKGLKKTNGDSAADLLIGYQTTEHIDEKFAGYGDWGTGPGWHATSSGKAWMVYQGELAVAMYDATKHELVWKGVASKALDPKASPEKRQKNLNKAVAKLMKDYPPPVQK